MRQSTLSPAELEFRKLVSRLYWGEEEPSDWGGKDPNDIPRPLHIAAAYAYWNHLSGLLIQVDGSPPKGTIVVVRSPDSIDQVTFLTYGRSKTLQRDSEPFKVVEAFVDELIVKGAVKGKKNEHT